MGTPELLIQRISIGFLKHDSASVLAFGRQGLIVNTTVLYRKETKRLTQNLKDLMKKNQNPKKN